MRQPSTVSWIGSLLESLLPKDIGETAVGDLAEEFLIQADAESPRRAAWWYARQVAASIPGLLLLSVKRPSWLLSLGIAVLVYFALRFVEPRLHFLIGMIGIPGVALQLFIDLAVGSLVCLSAGYVSTWIRRGSALPLAVIGTVAVSFMVVGAGDDAPLWYLAAFMVIAPAAPIAGAAYCIRRADRGSGRKV